MAWKVDDRIPEDLFVKLMIEKANIIKDHLLKEYASIDNSGQYRTHYGSV